jgi:L-ascorbate metabolism protein UlaG (beta-lactamase superfamily)
MELQYFGANCLKFSTKKSVVVVDPSSDITKLKVDLKKVNTILVTQPTLMPDSTEKVFVVDGPGEYEFEDYAVKGIPAQSHTAASGDKSATMYVVSSNDVRVLVLGHVDPKLSEEQLESIGIVDVVIVPVGGTGYTLDAHEAANVIRAIEPKLVVPVHSSDDGFSYDIAQQETELFVKELGAPVAEDKPDKYKFKALPEQLTVQLLQKQ